MHFQHSFQPMLLSKASTGADGMNHPSRGTDAEILEFAESIADDEGKSELA